MRLLVIGLDCVPPEFVFERFAMPHLRALMRRGSYGPLGISGFRNRQDYTYEGLGIANSPAAREPAIGARLPAPGRQVILVGVPPSFPPRPVNGVMVSCFLTPSAKSEYTHPAALKPELEARFGEYLFDVADFRPDDKAALLRRAFAVSEQKFAIVRHLMTTRPWDFCMFVDMGPDRLHHGFWKYWDRAHVKHEPGNPFLRAFPEYYAYLDEQIGALLEVVADDVAVLVVSEHGAKRRDGATCVHQRAGRGGE